MPQSIWELLAFPWESLEKTHKMSLNYSDENISKSSSSKSWNRLSAIKREEIDICSEFSFTSKVIYSEITNNYAKVCTQLQEILCSGETLLEINYISYNFSNYSSEKCWSFEMKLHKELNN